ncbi:uncharacterized protein V1518DRAFT_422883 [Limtongia smithiae]|uniref:uncharacterized protein n=1 Tax=Limtongia smithiae TaxID=1125753 RepID=UPI0034CED4F1
MMKRSDTTVRHAAPPQPPPTLPAQVQQMMMQDPQRQSLYATEPPPRRGAPAVSPSRGAFSTTPAHASGAGPYRYTETSTIAPPSIVSSSSTESGTTEPSIAMPGGYPSIDAQGGVLQDQEGEYNDDENNDVDPTTERRRRHAQYSDVMNTSMQANPYQVPVQHGEYVPFDDSVAEGDEEDDEEDMESAVNGHASVTGAQSFYNGYAPQPPPGATTSTALDEQVSAAQQQVVVVPPPPPPPMDAQEGMITIQPPSLSSSSSQGIATPPRLESDESGRSGRSSAAVMMMPPPPAEPVMQPSVSGSRTLVKSRAPGASTRALVVTPQVSTTALAVTSAAPQAPATTVNTTTIPTSPDELNSAFVSPVPFSGNPTDVLSQRFSVWRRVLKDIIAYFEEVAVAQDARAKAHAKLANIIPVPFRDTSDMFLRSGGIQDTTGIIHNYHKAAGLHASDSREKIGGQVVPRLKDLRRDLSFKIKEIKGLSGDFKNSVSKELEATKKQVGVLTEALSAMAVNPHLVSGKYDPYIVKLAVERQLRKQIEEENYLHQAYLNIETSGQALEEIVVKEIQQAFETYCKCLETEAQDTLDAAHKLTINFIELPSAKEWTEFVRRDANFIDPSVPVRKLENIVYPGRDDPATVPIRAGLLERRTKYLKSYTSAWYVLTPTYLHEFKTSDRKTDLTPVMSLLLQDCTLAEHSEASAHSFKFLMKGKQSGQLHRGHSWMFRAESYEKMMVWYDDIKRLTEAEEGSGATVVARRNGTGGVISGGRPSSEFYAPGANTSASVLAHGVARRLPPTGASTASQSRISMDSSLSDERFR